MPQNDPGPQEDKAGLDRLILFSDAVIAIAITLMALEIKIPESVASEDLPRALAESATSLISYLWSFVVVAIYWIEHHRMFKYFQRFDRRLLWLNLLFLFLIVLVPFPTDLIDRYGEQQISVLLYAVLMALIGLVLAGIWGYAVHNHRLVGEDIPPREVRLISLTRLVMPAVFIASIPVIFLNTAVAMYMWLAVLPLLVWARLRA